MKLARSEMRRPLCALRVDRNPEVRKAIINGTQKITILEGHHDYKIDDEVMLCCHLDPWAVKVEIIGVYHTWLTYVTRTTYKAGGFKNPRDMLNGLRKLYPNITMSSPVTVIRWHNVSGALVEEAERIKALKKHYPQDCQCKDYERGLVANDCHEHNEFPRHFVGDEDLPCDCATWKNAKATCEGCDDQATWVRRTQFAGNHFFCDDHAKAESGFGDDDSDLFFWEKLK